MRIDVKPVAELTADEEDERVALAKAVYPPEVGGDWPGRHLSWASPEWRVLVWSDDDRLVSHAALVSRAAMANGNPVQIGGIGGVMTHPQEQGHGYGAAAMRRALEFLRDDIGVDFALLVCEPRVAPFYARLGWKSFTGTLLTEQPGGTVPFTFNNPMVIPARSDAPDAGTIDLCGPPW